MILLVASEKDVAGLNIVKQILSNYRFEKTTEKFQENPIYATEVEGKNVRLITLKEEAVYAQNLKGSFSGLQLVIFVSRHSSVSGTPTLSVHTPGNLGKADLGGISRKVSISPANTMRHVLKAVLQFKEEMGLDYEVSYECTHHGPSLDVPAMFAELGSSSRQWNDVKAAEAVAHAIIKAVSKFGDFQAKVVLGIGGLHYNAKFTRMALENEIAFSHMIPKYAMQYIDEEILRQCIQKTLEKVDSVFLDWKGIKGEHKSKLVSMLEEIGIMFEKV